MIESLTGFSAILWMVISFLGGLLPFSVVIGHFCPFWIGCIVFAIYYFASGVFPVACGTIQMILTAVGFYFAFTEFPLWFALLYTIVCLPAVIRTIILFFSK